jgi:hypothetical protein
MTYDVENPGPSLEQAHIVWLWFRFVAFKALSLQKQPD